MCLKPCQALLWDVYFPLVDVATGPWPWKNACVLVYQVELATQGVDVVHSR